VLAVIFGVKQIAQDGLHLAPLAAIAGGIGGRRGVRAPASAPCRSDDRRAAFPAARVPGSLAINSVSLFVAAGYFLYIAQYLQLMVRLSPLQAGRWSAPSAAGSSPGRSSPRGC
jgi:DHA2 family multidrug resistance protein-like MFS transporter